MKSSSLTFTNRFITFLWLRMFSVTWVLQRLQGDMDGRGDREDMGNREEQGGTGLTSVTWVTRGNMGENFVDICRHQWAGLFALATYGDGKTRHFWELG